MEYSVKVDRYSHLKESFLYRITEDYLIQEVESENYVGAVSETGWKEVVDENSSVIYNLESELAFFKQEDRIELGEINLETFKEIEKNLKLHSIPIREVDIRGIVGKLAV
jgi:hypothetical protein